VIGEFLALVALGREIRSLRIEIERNFLPQIIYRALGLEQLVA